MAADGSVECVYSSDDGDTWSTSTVASSGSYPDIYADDTTLLCAYIDAGNLYLVNSTDGGATWSEPVQINDEDGTVVMEENSVDIHRAGIVWVDNRNTDKDIYYQSLETGGTPPEANLEITEITEGFMGLVGISVTIKNTGAADAIDVNWTISFDGGIIKALLHDKKIVYDRKTNGTFDKLAPGDTKTIKLLVLGFGGFLRPIVIKVTAKAANADTVQKQENAIVVLVFVKIR